VTALAERVETAVPERVRRDWPFLGAGAVIVLASVFLRWFHQTSAYELFMDEIQYADVGNSFAAGRGPELFGEPFFLHPPSFFVLVGWATGDPWTHNTADTVLGLRWVELPFAFLNTALVVFIAFRLAGRRAALVAGAIYALDPFVIRFDSRLMLEAPMLTGVLAGFACAIVGTACTGRRRRLWLGLAALAFGVALITKTTSALVTTLPLILMFATGWGIKRREAVGMIAVQSCVYAVYAVWVLLSGNVVPWFTQTLSGVSRASGVVTETGFNSADAPSFSSRILANLSLFAPSYLLMAIAGSFAAYLMVTGFRSLGEAPSGAHSRRAAHAGGDDGPARWLVCWFAGVGVAILYTFGFGEVEEQTFYLLCVPSAILAGVLAATASRSSRKWRVAVIGVAAVGLLGAGVVWYRVHTEPDDGYHRLQAFLSTEATARDGYLALGEHTAQFVSYPYGLVSLQSIEQAHADGARWALVSTQLSALGLAPTPTSMIHELQARTTEVFRFDGRTTGSLILFDLGPALPQIQPPWIQNCPVDSAAWCTTDPVWRGPS
jgi:hypothetical protein